LESASKPLSGSNSLQQEKLASLGQATAGIAHEIKNPLQLCEYFSDLKKGGAPGKKKLIDEVFAN